MRRLACASSRGEPWGVPLAPRRRSLNLGVPAALCLTTGTRTRGWETLRPTVLRSRRVAAPHFNRGHRVDLAGGLLDVEDVWSLGLCWPAPAR